MAKFGLFERDDNDPILTYDGDYIIMEAPYTIVCGYTSRDQSTAQQTANVHLKPGQSVKKIG